jgi:uncharacterized protein (DUF2141 family)
MRFQIPVSVITLVTLQALSVSHAGDLSIKVNNVASNNGNINIAVFDDEASFNNPESLTARYHSGLSLAANMGFVSVVLENLPPGKYAIIAFQDENQNDDLDTNIVGYPIEPIGLSGNFSFKLNPSFEKSHFLITNEGLVEQVITLINP